MARYRTNQPQKKSLQEPEQEDDFTLDDDAQYETKENDRYERKKQVAFIHQTTSDYYSDTEESEDIEQDSLDEDHKPKTQLRRRHTSTGFNRRRNITHDEDSDLESDYSSRSSDYDSDDSELSNNVIGRCCGCLGNLIVLTRGKTLRNINLGRKYSLIALKATVEFLRSEQLRWFVVNVVIFMVFIFRFVFSILKDVKTSMYRTIQTLAIKLYELSTIVGFHFLRFLGWSSKLFLQYSVVGFYLMKSRTIVLLEKLKRAVIFMVRSPYLMGKNIVNAPWILYEAFWENTDLFVPFLYSVIGWFVVLFVYLPIFGYILYAIDILTIEDLDALGIKNICVYFGLLPEEKKTTWDVLRKIWYELIA